MKKLIFAPAFALALSVTAAAPAHANPSAGQPVLTASGNPFAILIGMLLPAVQKVR